MPGMQTSRTGLELIKSFEGFRPRAVSLGKTSGWVIGYGHTGSARANLRISQEDAAAILEKYDLPPIEQTVTEAVYAPLNQNEFDALVSFVFNIGIEAFRGSDVLSRLNSGEMLGAANAMSAWRKARIEGRLIVVDALVRRRAVEAALFLEHPSGRRAAPTALLRPQLDIAASIMAPRERAVIVEETQNGDRLGLRRRDANAAANDTTDVTPEDQSAPEAAARAVTERLTRILGETNDVPPKPVSDDGVSVDEITAAVSALADPEGAASLADVSNGTVDDLERPVELAQQDIDRAMNIDAAIKAEDDQAEIMTWAPFAFLSFLGAVIFTWGGVKIASLVNSGDVLTTSGMTPGPFMVLLGGLLFVIMAYYLYRALFELD